MTQTRKKAPDFSLVNAEGHVEEVLASLGGKA